MPAGVVVKHKRKSGAFISGELAAGEFGLDVTNSKIYFSTDGTTIGSVSAGVEELLLQQLANVTITTVADNHVLAYDTSSSEWINQTAAQAGLSTQGHNHLASDVTDFQSSVTNNTSVAANTTARHTHSNKTVLDAITDAGSGIIISGAERTRLSNTLVTADKGAVNGVASLDGTGKVPTAQLPDTVLGSVDYQGTWNATTNTPNLGASTPTKGDYFVVSVSGATSLGGITDWKLGDWAIYNGTAWEKVDNTDSVTSVFTRTGAITAVAGDYSSTLISNLSTVTGAFVTEALTWLNNNKAASTHSHAAGDITTGDLATARMQLNIVSAINASTGTISTATLVIECGTLP